MLQLIRLCLSEIDVNINIRMDITPLTVMLYLIFITEKLLEFALGSLQSHRDGKGRKKRKEEKVNREIEK